MSETITLEAAHREVTGKKVKQYRLAGQIPAVIYGPDFTPINLLIEEPQLRRVLAEAGGTRLIELNIGGEKVPALARHVQRNPIRGSLEHVDFYRVAMDRPIRADVPLVFTGESLLVKGGEAIAIHLMTSITIETLPANLPDHLEVNISDLVNIGDQIQVGDLKVPSTIKVITHLDEPMVKLDYAERLEEEAPEVEQAVSAEVEVITARKEEEEGGEEA